MFVESLKFSSLQVLRDWLKTGTSASQCTCTCAAQAARQSKEIIAHLTSFQNRLMAFLDSLPGLHNQ